jgi:hypothetical protein
VVNGEVDHDPLECVDGTEQRRAQHGQALVQVS